MMSQVVIVSAFAVLIPAEVAAKGPWLASGLLLPQVLPHQQSRC